MALDIGEKRFGVALSDTTGVIASPLTVLDAGKLRADARPLVRLIEEYEVERVVVGLPLSLDGTEGPQAARVRAVAQRLKPALGVEIDFYDERHSSTEARRRMTESGMSSRDQRGAVDGVAAAVFLQSYLDASH